MDSAPNDQPWVEWAIAFGIAAVCAVSVWCLLYVALELPTSFCFFCSATFVWLIPPVGLAMHYLLFIPQRAWRRGLALTWYGLPLQFTVCWMLTGWPLSNFWTVHAILLSVVAILIIGTSSCFRRFALGPRRSGVAFACVLLPVSIVVIVLPVVIVIVEGLVALAKFDTVTPLQLPATQAAPRDIVFVQLSDTHLTGAAGKQTYERTIGGESLLPDYLARVRALQPPVVFLTGDVTDAGSTAQWASATALFGPLAEKICVVAAPGNHDLSAAYGDHDDGSHLSANFLAFATEMNPNLAAANGRQVQGLLASLEPRPEEVEVERIAMIDAATQMAAQLRRAQRRQNGIQHDSGGEAFDRMMYERRFTHEYVRRGMFGRRVDELWPALFPLRWRSADGQFAAFVLNSSTPAHYVTGRSALGAFGDDQIRRLCSMVSEAVGDKRTRAVFILSHHPVARPARAEIGLRELLDYAVLQSQVDEARQLVDLLQDWRAHFPGVDWFFLCGHRHRSLLGQLGGAWIVESPNLAPIGSKDRGVWAGYKCEGRLQVAWFPIE
jgi:predicted MPP superfamily phosphohydrolase